MKKQTKWMEHTIKKKKANNTIKNARSSKKVTYIFQNRLFLRLMIPVGMALVIGISLGIITIQMLKQENAYQTSKLQPTNINISEQNEASNENSLQFDPLTTYVIQAGLFSEENNAERWGEKFENQNYPVFIWNHEDQYYLFVGVFNSVEQAKIYTNKLDKVGLDVFVKEWSIDKRINEVTKEDIEWLTLFRNLWEKSLISVDNNRGVFIEEWIKLTNNSNQLSSNISHFNQKVNELVTNNRADDEKSNRHMLLQLLFEFEKL